MGCGIMCMPNRNSISCNYKISMCTCIYHNIHTLEHPSSLTVFCVVCIARSLVFCVVFSRLFFVLLSFFFWSLYCLVLLLVILLSCPSSFGHCIVLSFFFLSFYCLVLLLLVMLLSCPSSFGHCIVLSFFFSTNSQE